MPILWFFSFIKGTPEINADIIYVYIFALPLELTALLLYMRALRVSPLSLTVPFLSFTPAFLLFTSPLIMHESPSLSGIAGVLFIVLGAYSLNFNSISKGFFSPVKMIFKEPGSVMMLTVAFIYSITSNLGKMGVLKSNPAFFAASYFSALSIILFIIMIIKGNIKNIFKKELALIGIISAIMILFHMMAIELIFVSYMISIKRSSILFGIIFGTVFFKEKGLKEKLIGGILMIIGILIIAFIGS